MATPGRFSEPPPGSFFLWSRGFFAIEVKAGERVRGKDLRSLRSVGEDCPEAKRLLRHRGSEHFEIDGIQCSPADAFLRALHPAQELPFAR